MLRLAATSLFIFSCASLRLEPTPDHQELLSKVKSVETKVDSESTKISSLQSDLGTVKTALSAIMTELGTLKTGVAGVKADVANVLAAVHGNPNATAREDPHPVKRATGPEHRRCKPTKKKRSEVIGGTIVDDPTEFPFLAWLGDRDGSLTSQFCGGTLISDRIVLTAGHCLYNDAYKNARLWVRFRLANFAESVGIARDVINWKQHPKYDVFTLYNDLSLLLLNESVPADLVQPVPISNGTRPFEYEGEKMVVGWGSTDEQCMMYDTYLRKAAVPFGTPGPSCTSKGSRTLTTSADYDYKSQCCAGDYDDVMHYPGCGDSGGPLLAFEGNSWTQVGMVSWSYGIPWPDVFTRVSYFQDWIRTTAGELLAAGPSPYTRSPDTEGSA